MTITLHGDDVAVEQAAKQLYRLIDVLKVQDVTSDPTVEHELAFVKIRATDFEPRRGPAARRALARPGRRPGRWLGHRGGDGHRVRDRHLRVARADLRHQGVGPHRRRRDGEGFRVHRGGDQAMTAKMYYDNDADPQRACRADRRDHRVWEPGARPCAEPARERGRCHRRARAGLQEPGARRRRRPAGQRRRGRRARRRRRDDPRAGHVPEGGLRRRDRSAPAGRATS